MKKLLALGAIFGSLASLSPTSQAAVGSNTFQVTATLSSACTVAAFSGASLAFGTVTAFVAPPAPTAITSAISCTRTLTGVTAIFDTSAGVASSSAAGTSPTGDGLLSNNLRYTLTSTLVAGTAGTVATNASVGTADAYTFTVNAAMAAQAGSCTTGSCAGGTQTRTVTLNF